MLLQSVLEESEQDMLDSYAVSEVLLGEDRNIADKGASSASTSGLVDWSRLRGSPRKAMEETLSWTAQEYGSVNNYLELGCGVNLEKLRSSLR